MNPESHGLIPLERLPDYIANTLIPVIDSTSRQERDALCIQIAERTLRFPEVHHFDELIGQVRGEIYSLVASLRALIQQEFKDRQTQVLPASRVEELFELIPSLALAKHNQEAAAALGVMGFESSGDFIMHARTLLNKALGITNVSDVTEILDNGNVN